MAKEMMSMLFCRIVLLITAIFQTQGQDGIAETIGEEVIIPQCNSTCIYVEWAYDANCRRRDLESIPHECWEAKVLDLRNNRITQIVANAFEPFRDLLYVDLENNGVTDLNPSAFVGNDQVMHVYLQSNHLETIYRESFTGVPNLVQLYLNSNRISKMEIGAFLGLSKLENLFLSENLLEDIPPRLLEGLESLRYFHMTHNSITALRNNTFIDLSHLRHLNLINNDIRIIEAGAFNGLQSLRVLRLAYNYISIIGNQAFVHMKHLIQLDLYSNRIQTISNISTSIASIEELYLGDNPLNCDCQLEPLRLWYKMHYITDSKAKTECNTPEFEKGNVIADMDTTFCPISQTNFPKERIENSYLTPAKHTDNDINKNGNVNSYRIQSASIQNGTIIVIVIACIVLLAVCVVGFIGFVYSRKPHYDLINNNSAEVTKTPENV